MKNKLNTVLAASLIALLSACGGGGGGGDDSAGPSVGSLQGGYSGVASNGSSGNAVILEDGTVWSVSGVESGDFFIVESLIQGNLNLSGANVTSTNLREYVFDSGLTFAGGFTGTVAGSGVISGSVAATGSAPFTVTITPIPTVDFNYDTPATLAAIAGTWGGFFSTGDTGSVAISAGGVISSVTDAGCSISGSVTPRASGKNVYNVAISFGPAPCLLPNGSGAGIAVIVGSGASAQLTVAATTADRANGAAFFGMRP